MLITSGSQDMIPTMKKKKRLAEMSPEIQSDNETTMTEKNESNHNEKRKTSP
jgi:hypothetical protein